MTGGTPELAEELFEVAFGGSWDEKAKARWREDIARADEMGMREDVFAKVGDSQIAAYNALYGLGFLEPQWGGYEWLKPTLERYRRVALPSGGDPPGQMRPVRSGDGANSFNRSSAASRTMIVARNLLEPSAKFSGGMLGWFPNAENPPEESMLDCELRVLKPRFALINIGTNGQSYGFSPKQTAKHLGEVIKEVRRHGTAPVAMTIPPQLDRGEKQGRWDFARETSEAIRKVARKARVPLFDQWTVLSDERLTNFGMIEFDQGHFDGFHLETQGGFNSPDAVEQSVDFRPPALLYGANLRNLLLLMTLQALDEALGE